MGGPVRIGSRDDFSHATKRALAQRVGYLCSNPECRAHTTGPQSDPVKSINVGVAAHITAAAKGGPRFDSELCDTERKRGTNGIWLCQNCAKVIDDDPFLYAAKLLLQWKTDAEQEAKSKIGKTRAKTSSNRTVVSHLKRNHKMRDDLHRDLLKSPAERMRHSVGCSRMRKFAHTEVIIHKIGDTTYPNIDDSPGISGWFKLEVFDFYHSGLECTLGLEYALVDTKSRAWTQLTYQQSQDSFPSRFCVRRILITGKIPFQNILYHDMRGDEYYPQPHLYCQYANHGEPYEGRGYYLIDEQGGYEFSLEREEKRNLEDLLGLPN